MPIAYKIVITQAARTELIDAQDWYEGESTGLGKRFRAEVDAAIERLTANPLQFPIVFKRARRALLHGFPYMLFFLVESDSLLVIACFHASRDPRQWRKRT